MATSEDQRRRQQHYRHRVVEQLMMADTPGERRHQIAEFVKWEGDDTIAALHPLMKEIAANIFSGCSETDAVTFAARRHLGL